MLQYFSYGHAAKIFLIKYKVLQAFQKKQHTIPFEFLPNDSEALLLLGYHHTLPDFAISSQNSNLIIACTQRDVLSVIHVLTKNGILKYIMSK